MGTGLVVAAAYAEAVAQRQQLALSDYRRALTKDKALFSELSRSEPPSEQPRASCSADRAAASAQQSSLRATLAGVKGDLAVAVADVERQQEAVQAEEEKALLESISQLPRHAPHGRRPVTVGRPGGRPGPGSRPPADRDGERHERRADDQHHFRHLGRRPPGRPGSAGRRTTSEAPTTADAGPAEHDYLTPLRQRPPHHDAGAPTTTVTSAPPTTTTIDGRPLRPLRSVATRQRRQRCSTVSPSSTLADDGRHRPVTTTSLAPYTTASATTTAPVQPGRDDFGRPRGRRPSDA